MCSVSGIAGTCVLNIMLNICYNIDEICNVSGIAGTLAWQAARTMDIDHPPTQHQEHHTQFRLRENNQQISVWILHDKLGALMALQMYILGCCFFVRMFGLQKPFWLHFYSCPCAKNADDKKCLHSSFIQATTNKLSIREPQQVHQNTKSNTHTNTNTNKNTPTPLLINLSTREPQRGNFLGKTIFLTD